MLAGEIIICLMTLAACTATCGLAAAGRTLAGGFACACGLAAVDVAGAGRAVIQRDLDDSGRLLHRLAELCHRVVTHLVGEFLIKIESEQKSNR